VAFRVFVFSCFRVFVLNSAFHPCLVRVPSVAEFPFGDEHAAHAAAAEALVPQFLQAVAFVLADDFLGLSPGRDA
jgi:hypothetical protein